MAVPASHVTIATSVLGTKDHWDATYAAELNAYRADGTPGEEWFDDRLPAGRLTAFLRRLLPPPPTAVTVVDVGCGSGGVLIVLAKELAERSPPPRLVGVDYASDAVALATAVAAAAAVRGDGGVTPTFSVVDVLAPGALQAVVAGGGGSCFTLVHDKGTLDAFLLRSDAAAAVDAYLAGLRDSTQPGDVLAVTSCNLSRAELISTVVGKSEGEGEEEGGSGGELGERRWRLVDELPYRVMRFGGRQGAVLVTLAFVRQ
ncbi:hypothetical protein MMPV_006424 [Pyropia vietnamensis]